MKQLRVLPASFFGIILGLAGLGNAWRAAARLWALPRGIGESILGAAALCWAVQVIYYIAKWTTHPDEARAELKHPVLCCFIGLAPVSTALVGLAVAPYSLLSAQVLFWVGALGQLAFSLFRTGQLWQGGRDPNTTTPVLYLPSVAGSFVSSIVASALGYSSVASLFFGAGLFSWVAIESVILNRLYIYDTLARPLRPTLGIQLAPPVVGCLAYLGLTSGKPDLFAQMLLGYGLLQAFLLVRLEGWLREQPFGASYWAYTFGATALALSCLRFVDRGLGGIYVPLAIATFVGANLLVGWITAQSLRHLLRGDFVPAPLLNAITMPAIPPPLPASASIK